MALARKPFVVIDAEILSSSVWSETATTKLVWLTLLVLCDTEGYVGAALPGIATAAGVTLEQAESAIKRFLEPDPYSRTKANDGRRLEVAERGWRILNFRDHIDRLSAERAKSRERLRKWRARKRTETPGYVSVRTGKREQGVVSSEKTEGRKEEPALPPPPEQRAENATKDSIHSMQLRFAGLLAKLSEHPNSRRMVPEWCRACTEYTKSDGTKVRGVSDFRTIQRIERLEKSIEDAAWWLTELDKGVVDGAR